MFIRVHDNFLVNNNYVESIKRYELILKNGIHIPVSRTRYMDVKKEVFKKIYNVLIVNFSILLSCLRCLLSRLRSMYCILKKSDMIFLLSIVGKS